MKTKSTSLLHRAAAAATAAVVLALSSPAHAATHTWLGANATNISWGALGNFDVAFASGNTTDVVFNNSTVTNPNSNTGTDRTVRSITYNGGFAGPMGITFQTFNGGTPGNLTFDTDAGDATITVASGVTGNITIGNASSTAGTVGNPILNDNLVITHDGSGLLLFNRPFQAAAFGITKNGTGTMQTNNNNLLTGNLNVNGGTFIANGFNDGLDTRNFSSINLGGGTLQINAAANSKFSSNTLNVNSASTLAWFNSENATSRTLTVNGTAAFALNADLTVRNIVSGNASLTNAINISRNMTGTGGMNVETYGNVTSGDSDFAPGRVTLTGNNSGWSGNLTVRQGTAALGGNSTLGSGVGVNAGTGAIILGVTGNGTGAGLQLAAAPGGGVQTINNNIIVRSGGFRSIKLFSDHTYNLNGTIDLQGDLNLHNAAFFTDKTMNVNGNISGVGGLSITEASGGNKSFTRLTGNNTYSGNTTIGAEATLSVLSATAKNGIGDSSAVSLVGTNATLQIGNDETIGSLAASAGSNQAFLSGGNLTTGGNNGTTSFSANITGTGGLTKVGLGTMTLNGNNSYSGETNVNGGTLKLGSVSLLASPVVKVGTNGTMDVSDLAALTMGNGTRIGGDGAVTGNLSLADGARFIFTIGDTLSVSGSVSLNSTFSLASLVNGDGTGIAWASVGLGTYNLIDSSLTNFATLGIGNFTTATEVAPGKFAQFAQPAGNGTLSVVVVPEPSTALLVGGLACFALLIRRRTR